MADDSDDGPDLLGEVRAAYERLMYANLRSADPEWVCRVAKQTWPVALARLSRMARKLEGDPGEWLQTIAGDIAAAHVRGEPLGVTAEDMGEVRSFYRALRQLTQPQREYSLLRLRGLSPQCAAKRTNRSLDAANALAQRAKRRFRKAMEERATGQCVTARI